MRLFIAVDISEEIKNQIEETKKQIKAEGKINWVDKDKQHLTLKFLGEVPESQIKDIKAKLNTIKLKPFEAATKEIGVFPTEEYIRVIWIGFKDGNKITELKDKIEKSLLDLFPKDERFHPHLTFARIKFIKNKKQLIESIKSIKIQPKTFKIEKFKLYKSTLTPEGPVYEELAVFPA